MTEERDRLERAATAATLPPHEMVKVRQADLRAVLSALEAAEKRIAELERRVAKQDGLIPALKADSKQMNVNAVAYQAERKRAERAEARVRELEGEARVLIGCPCWCHTGDGPEPHGDCRECVRGTATPTAIDRDHTEAQWREKWTAALDLMGSQAERAERAEAENVALRAERDSADRGVARNAEVAAQMMRARDEARADRDRLREGILSLEHAFHNKGEMWWGVWKTLRALASGEESR